MAKRKLDAATQQAFDAWRRQADLNSPMPTATEFGTQQRKGNILTDLIPMVTGGLGAAAGTFFAPGGGTLVGGAAGSALGEAIRQKLVGEQFDLGNVATEGAWGMLPGATKMIGTAAKGGKLAAIAAKGADTTADAAKLAKITKAGSLADKASDLRMSARGFQNAGKVFDSATERKAASRLLSQFGLKGSASNQFNKIDDVIGALGNQADDIYAGTSKTINTGEFAKSFRGKASSVISSDKTAYRDAVRGVENLIVGSADGNQLSASKLSQIKRNLGTQLDSAWKKIQNGTSLAPKEEALMNAWKTTDDALIKLAPEAKKLTKAQSIMMKSRAILDKSAARSAPFQPLGIPIAETRMPNKIGSAIQDMTGRGLEAITGSAPARVAGMAQPGLIRQGAKETVKQGIGRGIGGLLLGGAPQEQAPVEGDVMTPEMLLDGSGLPIGGAGLDPFGAGGMGSDAQQGGIPRDVQAQMILQDMDQTGGENVTNLEKVFELLSPQPAEGMGPNVTSVTAQQYGLAQTGQQSLAQLSQLLAADPDVLNRARIPGRDIGLFGIGGSIANATDTAGFDTVGYNIADSLLRLRTGATANESEVRKLQSQIMPRAGDSPQTVQLKLQQLNQAFSGVLNLANQQPSQSFNPFMQFNQQAMGMPY